MAYIGSSAAVTPVAFSGVNAQSFNGDGSTVAFTLNRPVSSVAAIEVVVNNVQQSPYDGSYSVSNTTLTFSAAPSTGTGNIYVVYRDFPVGSITDPNAVTKTGDTMTGTLTINQNNSGGLSAINLPADETTIQGPVSNTQIRMGGNLVLNASGQASIGTNGVGSRVVIDSAGRVTMPYQPSFMATASQNSQTGVINFDGTYHNIGNHFSTSTDRFTAPVTGVYFFSWTTVMGTNFNGDQLQIRKNGVNLAYTGAYSGNNPNAYLVYPSATVSVIHYLNAGDYVDVYTATTIQANYGAFIGYLIG